jgi:hypothetical protein
MFSGVGGVVLLKTLSPFLILFFGKPNHIIVLSQPLLGFLFMMFIANTKCQVCHILKPGRTNSKGTFAI